jgi:putative Mn2+ efflux pump MntP
MGVQHIEDRDAGERGRRARTDPAAAFAVVVSVLSIPVLVVGIGLAWRWSPSEVKLGLPFIAWLLLLGAGCRYAGKAFGRARREQRRSRGGIVTIVVSALSLVVGISLFYLLRIVGEVPLF